jgi:hypothetical protein
MSEIQRGPATAKDSVRAIRILFGAIVTGALVFAASGLFRNILPGPFSPELKKYENIFRGIVIVIALICLIFARVKYNGGMGVIKDALISLPDKLNQYRATLILYVALCEGPALFVIILFFITGNYFLLVIAGILLGAVLIKAPTNKRITDELGLDRNQQQELE